MQPLGSGLLWLPFLLPSLLLLLCLLFHDGVPSTMRPNKPAFQLLLVRGLVTAATEAVDLVLCQSQRRCPSSLSASSFSSQPPGGGAHLKPPGFVTLTLGPTLESLLMTSDGTLQGQVLNIYPLLAFLWLSLEKFPWVDYLRSMFFIPIGLYILLIKYS